MELLRRFPGLLLILALLLAAAPIRAASPAPPARLPRKVRIEYIRAPGARDCPDEDTFRYAVAGHTASTPFAQDAPDRLIVTIQRQGAKYKALAEIRDSAGSVLWSFPTTQDECHLVTDALSIAIGLALDAPEPKVEAPAAPPAASAAPGASSPAVPGPSAAPALSAAPSSADAEDQVYFTAHKVRPRVSLAVLGAFGLMPSPSAYGAQFGIGAQWRRFSLSLESRALFSTPVELSKDRTAFTAVVLAMLTPCAHTEIARPLYSLDFCAWLGAGRMIFEPNNDTGKPFIRSEQIHPFTIMAGVRPLVTWQFSPKYNPEFLLKPFTELDVGAFGHRITFNGDVIWNKVPWGLVVGVEVSALVGQPPKWDKPLAKDPEVARGY